MIDDGFTHPVADRTYKFTQIAWGRVLLERMGIRFAPNYFCFNKHGEIIESGLLSDQPYFQAAMRLAVRHPTAWIPNLAVMSAEVSTVNRALKSGSKPEDLVTSPPGLFMEVPTPAGIEKARLEMSKQSENTPKKPWWRFW
jgi:hypothetical protein